jgi:hypothetical protein
VQLLFLFHSFADISFTLDLLDADETDVVQWIRDGLEYKELGDGDTELLVGILERRRTERQKARSYKSGAAS